LDSILDTTTRSIILYFLIIVVLRLLGKKGLAQLSLTDFVLVLLITKSVYNDQGLFSGVSMVIALTVINYGMDYIIYKSKKARKIIVGEPVILIDNGKLKQEALKSEKVTIDELIEFVRQNGLMKIEDVKWAIMETDGSVSVIPKKKE
jgi:uncharacterized membrane protein YcaP (DUF421 family)